MLTITKSRFKLVQLMMAAASSVSLAYCELLLVSVLLVDGVSQYACFVVVDEQHANELSKLISICHLNQCRYKDDSYH